MFTFWERRRGTIAPDYAERRRGKSKVKVNVKKKNWRLRNNSATLQNYGKLPLQL